MIQQIDPPRGFVFYEYKRNSIYSEEMMDSVWHQLQRLETFTKGQLFPYRVGFAASSQEGEFTKGELNIHHRPFLSAQMHLPALDLGLP